MTIPKKARSEEVIRRYRSVPGSAAAKEDASRTGATQITRSGTSRELCVSLEKVRAKLAQQC